MTRTAFWLALLLLLPPWPAAAGEPVLSGDLVQGGLVTGRVVPGTEVSFLGRRVRIAADGRFVIGFGRDFGPKAELKFRHADGRVEVRELAIRARQYRIQRIDGLPPKMVTPGAEALKRIRREAALIRKVRATDTGRAWFADGFVWPVMGPISSVFGSQRILNGEPRRPHYGVDVAAPEGSTVRAPAPGRVALAEADLYFTGGTVMLDHGHGLTSAYSHLATVTVEVGQVLARGDPLGTLGGTGRATGPHLDWRLNWFDQRLDPALLVGPMPAPASQRRAPPSGKD
jgi:murein DD-endopeptidase MepM/ murein hydrolase activator NlpD